MHIHMYIFSYHSFITEVWQIDCRKWTQALGNKDWSAETEAACKFGNLEALKLFHELSPETTEELVAR